MKKLLLVFAHPDDASRVAGVTAQHYEQTGWQVITLDATQLGYAEGSLSRLTSGTLEDPIYQKMEEELPNVVVTFDTTGINNNPDHIKVCYATTYAFQKYAAWLEGLQKKFRVRSSHDELWFKRLEHMVDTRIDPKLYYVCIPQSALRHALTSRAVPAQSHGKPWRGTPDGQITTVIGGEYFILRMEGTKEHFMGKNDRVSDRL